jgi:hypothetical protein
MYSLLSICRNVRCSLVRISPKLLCSLISLCIASSFISLYLVHDVLDARFRRVQYLNTISLLYISYFVAAVVAITFYVAVQWTKKGFQEVGAAVVALLVSSYGFWKLLRLQRILVAHKHIVDSVLTRTKIALERLTAELPGPGFVIDYSEKRGTHSLANDKEKPDEQYYLYLASSIFGTFGTPAGVSW